MAVLAVYNRLDSNGVHRQKQLAFLRVPDREREHSVESLQTPDTPLLVRVKKDLRVAGRPESMALLLEFPAQQFKIVDLAVKHDRHRFVFVPHGLMAAIDVDDTESSMAQPYSLGEQDPLVVRAAVSEGARQPIERIARYVVSARIEYAGNSAHGLSRNSFNWKIFPLERRSRRTTGEAPGALAPASNRPAGNPHLA